MASWRFPGAALALLSACGFVAEVAPQRAFVTLDGAMLQPLLPPPGALRVLVFVTTDCPIANQSLPTIAGLAAEFGREGVEFVLVHVDPDTDTAKARAHADAYAILLPVVLDPEQRLAAAVGVQKTPEVAVVRRGPGDTMALRYRGRVDDRWRGFGQDSQEPEREDLRERLQRLLQADDGQLLTTPVVGCFLPELQAGAVDAQGSAATLPR